MAKIRFPPKLEALLKDSPLQAPIRSLADRVGIILHQNQMPFFPAYTDHGVDHVNNVLAWEVKLIPAEVWAAKDEEGESLLSDADAAILIGGTLLHDFAMYLQPAGFLELISPDTRFKPLPWFRDEQDGHPADLAWSRLWEDFEHEAKRFSDSKLEQIVGLKAISSKWRYQRLPADSSKWDEHHKLVIGEFLRRHHARIAHEIAIYGFPGLRQGFGTGEFPVLNQSNHELKDYADLIGLVARSHGISLRVCQSYLEGDSIYVNSLRPKGSAVVYPMALLRVADYFQLDAARAPPVLLQLKDPQSTASLVEWEKHKSIVCIGDSSADPRGKTIVVNIRDISLEIYLQISALMAGLQFEIDHSTAVLDEAYGLRNDLRGLCLSIRRVHSNINTAAFRNKLPYIAEKTGISVDPRILGLLVEPLYGKEPSAAIRELIQNSVDAVRELHGWCENRGKEVQDLDLMMQETDVVVEYDLAGDPPRVRVRDRGIGMTADTIQNYFLRAGASFRQSSVWLSEFANDEGRPKIRRAGRFGIGAFAIFLLGPTFRLRTRHVTSDGSGFEILIKEGCSDVEIKRCGELKIGTVIDIDLDPDAVAYLSRVIGKKSKFYLDWYCWSWPSVAQFRLDRSGAKPLKQRLSLALDGTLPMSWSRLNLSEYIVWWTFREISSLTLDGFWISSPPFSRRSAFDWPVDSEVLPPSIAVAEKAENLPLTATRYDLARRKLPFVEELLNDVILSFIAYALVCGPRNVREALVSPPKHPLSWDSAKTGVYFNPVEIASMQFQPWNFRRSVPWCVTNWGAVPCDPWLVSLLEAKSLIIFGGFGENRGGIRRRAIGFSSIGESLAGSGHALGLWSAGSENGDGLFGRILNGGVDPLGIGELLQVIVVVGKRFRPSVRRRSKFAGRKWVPFSKREDGYEKWRWVHSLSELDQLDYLVVHLENSTVFLEMEDLVFGLETQPLASGQPESRLARIWSECFGARAIPFDSEKRKEMVASGRQHRDLKRHIDAWEEMRRRHYRWANLGNPSGQFD